MEVIFNKVKNIDIPNDNLLVIADVVGLYPNIPHRVGLKGLRNALENRNFKEIPTKHLIKMAKFVLKNNNFEFHSSVFSTNFWYCYRDRIYGSS